MNAAWSSWGCGTTRPSGCTIAPHEGAGDGRTGFVGSHLLEALLRRGDTVRALVRSRPGPPPWVSTTWRGSGAISTIRGPDPGQRRCRRHLSRRRARHGARRTGVPRRQRRRNPATARAATRSGRDRPGLFPRRRGTDRTGRPLIGTEPPRPVTAYGRASWPPRTSSERDPSPGRSSVPGSVRTRTGRCSGSSGRLGSAWPRSSGRRPGASRSCTQPTRRAIAASPRLGALGGTFYAHTRGHDV